MNKMSGESLRVALVQMTSTEDATANRDFLLRELDSAWAAHGPFDFVSTPENSMFMRLHAEAVWPVWKLDDPFFTPFKTWAREHNCGLHIGSIPLMNGAVRFNSTLWISDLGEISAPYQKIHLFDVDVPGAPAVRESAQFGFGEKPYVLEFRGWKIGLSICYDLRFAELYQVYQQAEVDAIVIPSAFLVPTGKAHWEVLLRARAIEAQAFVIAAAQAGTHVGTRALKDGGGAVERKTWGHSLVVSPWGEVLVDAQDAPGVTVVTLDKAQLSKVRVQIPMKNHRRLWSKK